MSLETIEDYKKLLVNLENLSPEEKRQTIRYLLRTDLFFLMWFGFRRTDVAHPFLFERCKEVEASPNNHLDLWARDHRKSSIITFAKTIQDILASHGENRVRLKGQAHDREPTFGIFSFTRPIAKSFLRQIKREFEQNELLRTLFPDIIWKNPRRDAPKWSDDDGIIMRRNTNPKESTVEAWGLIDGQPTSRHFDYLIYDDVVTIDNTRNPDMIAKTTEAWELSINLGTQDAQMRVIGSRYHFFDTYYEMMKREAVVPRIYPATKDGTIHGEPVLLTQEQLNQKYKKMGQYVFSAQMLLNPVADESQAFIRDWLKYYDETRTSFMEGFNRYITVDPAHSKKRGGDYTVIVVTALGSDGNIYIVDMVRDRLNLVQRTQQVIRLHKKYKPILVGYEEYGLQADIEHLQESMNKSNYRFHVEHLKGSMPKIDRIRRLLPYFQNGQFFLPTRLLKTNYEGKTEDLVEVFIEQEYCAFPVMQHDDILDAMSRIFDEKMGIVWPLEENLYVDDDYSSDDSNWGI